jgi:hypothetical protein
MGYSLLVVGILVFYNLIFLPKVLKMWKKLRKEGKWDIENAPLLTGEESIV